MEEIRNGLNCFVMKWREDQKALDGSLSHQQSYLPPEWTMWLDHLDFCTPWAALLSKLFISHPQKLNDGPWGVYVLAVPVGIYMWNE